MCMCAFFSIDLSTTVALVKLTLRHERKQGQEEKESLCISPGEWLNESEEASDRE